VDLHPGLVGRLLAGLVVTVEPPDLETRRRIVEDRARRLGVRLAPDVLEFVALHVTRSVRDLCGAVATLQAHAAIGERVDIPLARRCLGDLLRAEPPPAPEAVLLGIVAEELSVPKEAILGSGRRPEVAQARQVAMYLTRRLTVLSLREIGAFFGRQPSTVAFAEGRVEALLATDEGVRRAVQDATSRFRAAHA
jgi:chromosomal replication initiator protein